MELNLPIKKYVIFLIYRPPKENINYYLNSLSEGLDFYSKQENICMLVCFNVTCSNRGLTLFLENQNLKSMIKYLTCYKSLNGSAISISLAQTIAISIKKVTSHHDPPPSKKYLPPLTTTPKYQPSPTTIQYKATATHHYPK